MAFTLTVAGTDFAPHLRVAPGEGFDPFDVDLIEYGMSESTGLEGPTLLSETAGAREMIFPVHLTPLKESAYADTKQGMHDFIRDVNGLLIAAKGKTAVWQDEGAADPTTYDIIAARFESEYNFRRAQKMWGSGFIRIWTKPFGRAAAYRIIGTSVATGLGAAVNIPAGSVNGDAPAHIRVGVQTGSMSARGNIRAVGVAVVPSGYAWDIPVASINSLAGLASFQDPANLGSYSMAASQFSFTGYKGAFGVIHLSPATMYAGRNRLFAAGRGAGFKMRAYLEESPVGAGGTPSTVMNLGHNIMDLGVVDIDPLPGQATVSIELRLDGPFYGVSNDGIWSAGVDGIGFEVVGMSGNMMGLSRLAILPDDAFALAVDSQREMYGWHDLQANPNVGEGTVLDYGALDKVGNAFTYEIAGGGTTTMRFGWDTPNGGYGVHIASAAGSLPALYGYFIGDYEANMDAHLTFLMAPALPSVAIGLMTGGVSQFVARVHQTNATRSVFGLYGATTLVAGSQAINTPTIGLIELRRIGKEVMACLWNPSGALLASIGFTSNSPDYGGYGMAVHAAPSAGLYVGGLRAETIASVAKAPRDRIVFDSAKQVAHQLTSASVFQRSLRAAVRGNIPTLSPTIPQQVIGFQLPMTGEQKVADVVDTVVEAMERWRYAR